MGSYKHRIALLLNRRAGLQQRIKERESRITDGYSGHCYGVVGTALNAYISKIECLQR